MKTRTKAARGYSLLELLMVIAIIGILASVVLVNVSSSKQRAKDMIALAIMDSAKSEVLRCLLKNVPTYKVANPEYCDLCSPSPGPICINTPASAAVSGISKWPDMRSAGGWQYGSGSSGVNFAFCLPGYSGLTHPTDIASPDYGPGDSHAPNVSTGSFCYMLCNDNCAPAAHLATKWVWCTENGCKKEGF